MNKPTLIAQEVLENKIHCIRGQKVMLDRDLASLYGVPTKYLNQQVRRNIERFPNDFMFSLETAEEDSLRLQFATSKKGRGGQRYATLVFTEQGVAMLSSVLNSERAIYVNIAIMRAFVHLRRILTAHTDLSKKLEALERTYDKRFSVVFEVLRRLMKEDEKPKPEIGFRIKSEQSDGMGLLF